MFKFTKKLTISSMYPEKEICKSMFSKRYVTNIGKVLGISKEDIETEFKEEADIINDEVV